MKNIDLKIGIGLMAFATLICPMKELWLALILLGICMTEVHYAKRKHEQD